MTIAAMITVEMIIVEALGNLRSGHARFTRP
jgi:hypothetical protein